MAINRLFIYDPKNKRAVCIGKGYSNGWYTGMKYIDDWLDLDNEFTGEISKTRFELRTENDLPIDFKNVTWEPIKKHDPNLVKWIVNHIIKERKNYGK